MGTQTVTESEFNALQFEKQLTSLKDSQDSINTCCQWCLQNRVHHKKIVNAWLNVLKRVKVEQRLILFYLANDVVQYSKRRNYEYVESWGTALQKATTMVRDDRVKHKILRIFKIWEQRNVYNEEFISDLCGLLSVVPSGSKSDEPHEFQSNYVINKIKICAKLDKDTDAKLKILKEHNPKIQIGDGLIASLKDRVQFDDVEKEIDTYAKHMEDYINALKLEIKNRITLISVLKQAETQLEADRKDVKIVVSAYKMFGTRVKTFQKKLDEHKATLSSPIPSPDINAPSPSPDSDIELPGEGEIKTNTTNNVTTAMDYNPKKELQYTNAGYYNPVTSQVTDTTSSFINGFSSFIGSDISFNIENLGSTLFSTDDLSQNVPNNTPSANNFAPVAAPPVVQNPPLPVEAPSVTNLQTSNYPYPTGHLPLLPPPMPPFSKSDTDYEASNYNLTYSTTNTTSTTYGNTFTSTTTYDTPPLGYNTQTQTSSVPTFVEKSFEPPRSTNPYPPTEEYNPEDDLIPWETDASWNPTEDIDTPESPPMFEKEGYRDPVEYHDNLQSSGAVDVDHRVLPGLAGDLEDSLSSLGGKDVDHRNLISLTGSPGNSNSNNPCDEHLWNQIDQDYRVTPSGNHQLNADKDYRLNFNIEQLKLPPPPPPPPKPVENTNTNKKLTSSAKSDATGKQQTLSKSPRKVDNTESIDMDLSDDDIDNKSQAKQNDNLKVIVDNSVEEQPFSLEPPPPLPDLPDDVDANNFLDDLSNELHEFSNLSDELSNSNPTAQENNLWSQPLVPPPMMNFGDMISPQLGPMNVPPTMNPMNHSLNPMNANMNPPIHPPPNSMMHPPPMPPLLPPQLGNWGNEEEKNPWLDGGGEGDGENNVMNQDWPQDRQNNWSGPHNPNFGFRGRGNRGGFNGHFNKSPRERGRGRGSFNRGLVNSFRGNRGVSRGVRGHRGRGNFWGNFRGGF